MRLQPGLLGLALAATCSAAAVAQSMTAASPVPAMPLATPAAAATPIPLQPKPDFTTMKYFVGKWSCTQSSSRRPTPELSTVSAVLDPGGRWIKQITITKPNSWFPHKVTTYDFFTYDSDGKRWVDVTYDDVGGYDLSSSSGWTGSTIVWKDLAFTPERDVTSEQDTTYTKVSAKKFSWTTSFATTAGHTVGVTGSCTRV